MVLQIYVKIAKFQNRHNKIEADTLIFAASYMLIVTILAIRLNTNMDKNRPVGALDALKDSKCKWKIFRGPRKNSLTTENFL